MPELPEVETVVRDLRPRLVGRRIESIRVGNHSLRRPWQEGWPDAVVGRTVTSLRRRGKWILVDLKPGSHLLVHLGMTGQFTVVPVATEEPTHLHCRFALDDGHELRFRDVRRFGSIDHFADDLTLSNFLAERLGPEPFDLQPDSFHDVVASSNRTLKAILLDQTVLAGVGNIYADEALFRSRLHPQRRGNLLTRVECDRLRKAVVAVLTKAIDSRGSTIRDYIGGSGLRGGFQDEFCVYGRTGEACVKCRTKIEKVRVVGRSSHFCPKCQQSV